MSLILPLTSLPNCLRHQHCARGDALAPRRSPGVALRPGLARPPSEHIAGNATTSGRSFAASRLVVSAATDSYGTGGSQFSQFRNFQRQASTAARQEGQAGTSGVPAEDARRPASDGSGGGTGGAGTAGRRPYNKHYWRNLPQGWFAKPEYTPATLYEEIVQRCEKNTCGVDALYMVCKLAATAQEARVALNAFAAVRASLVRQGRVAPYDARLAVAFTHMIRTADAPDVLVEALRRAPELGLLLSQTRVHELLQHWGEQGELAKIEEVLGSMPLGGVPYNHTTAYIVIRTAVNLGAMDKAEYYANAMLQRQIRLTPSATRLLEAGRERLRQQQRQAAADAAAMDEAGTQQQ